MNKLADIADFLRRKVLRQHHWQVLDDKGKRKRIRVDALPVEQFKYQREAAALRLRQIHDAQATS